jgi:hypothetical protein
MSLLWRKTCTLSGILLLEFSNFFNFLFTFNTIHQNSYLKPSHPVALPYTISSESISYTKCQLQSRTKRPARFLWPACKRLKRMSNTLVLYCTVDIVWYRSRWRLGMTTETSTATNRCSICDAINMRPSDLDIHKLRLMAISIHLRAQSTTWRPCAINRSAECHDLVSRYYYDDFT